MPVIKAFVGHSFRPVDKPVVDAILDVLNRVKQLRSDFDWDHALEPEPKTVDRKVLVLFRTRRSLSVSARELRERLQISA